MYWLRLLRTRLRGLLRKKSVESEMEEELRFHLGMRAAENVRAGMAPEEAKRAALRSFGQVSRIKEYCRDFKGGGLVETLLQDVKFGARTLGKNPGFALIVTLTLALGIGANTAIFSFVNAVLLRPLPVAEPERLVYVFGGTRATPYNVSSYPDYVDYRDRNNVFSDLIAYSPITLSLNDNGQAEMISGLIVTGNYFDALGVSARVGRTFLPEEDTTPGGHPVAVISHGLWQGRFGADPGIAGRKLLLNGQPFTIVGVSPSGFNGAALGETYDIYVPMAMQALVRPPRGGYSGEMNPDLLSKRGPRWLDLVGRLKPGVSAEEAQAALGTLAAQLAQAYPDTNRDQTATVSPVSGGDPTQRGTLRSVACLLLAVVGLVLLIACANVANLLLARAAGRRKEISLRLALGASRGRLVRQLLTESLLLALLGGASGLLLAVWLVNTLRTYSPPANFFPVAFDFSLDGNVLGFTLLLSIVTGLVFGIAPALQASNPDLIAALKDEAALVPGAGGRTARRFSLRNLLVVAQVALSLVLLISAGLFLRSLQQAQRIDPGFDPERVLTMPLNINLLRYTKTQGQEFYRQVLERVGALPGVQSATLTRTPPLSGASRQSTVTISGAESPDRAGQSESSGGGGGEVANNLTLTSPVGPDYFRTLNIPLMRGRDFTAQDREGAPGVAIVNETFARRYFPGEDPIGQRVSLGGARGPWLEVVGLARDGKYITLGEAPAPFLYQPLAQRHETGMVLLVRAGGDPAQLVAAVRGEVRAIEPNVPLTNSRTMEDLLSTSLYPARMGATLLGAFGLLALLLASVGLYGVVSYSVSRRTREIGIRMALGARGGDVLRLVLRQSMTLVAFGVLLGLAAAFAATRMLVGFLYGVSPTDPSAFVGIAVLLTLVSLAASLVPARRAARIDPLVAFKHE
ncbi:MAG TPA: ABC transporter permease [Pyrinomonadaceae bacterium]|jgi:predicted permease|nr:ABC transporter permease [Pyrinomonadaceae bacterium]